MVFSWELDTVIPEIFSNGIDSVILCGRWVQKFLFNHVLSRALGETEKVLKIVVNLCVSQWLILCQQNAWNLHPLHVPGVPPSHFSLPLFTTEALGSSLKATEQFCVISVCSLSPFIIVCLCLLQNKTTIGLTCHSRCSWDGPLDSGQWIVYIKALLADSCKCLWGSLGSFLSSGV